MNSSPWWTSLLLGASEQLKKIAHHMKDSRKLYLETVRKRSSSMLSACDSEERRFWRQCPSAKPTNKTRLHKIDSSRLISPGKAQLLLCLERLNLFVGQNYSLDLLLLQDRHFIYQLLTFIAEVKFMKFRTTSECHFHHLWCDVQKLCSWSLIKTSWLVLLFFRMYQKDPLYR